MDQLPRLAGLPSLPGLLSSPGSLGSMQKFVIWLKRLKRLLKDQCQNVVACELNVFRLGSSSVCGKKGQVQNKQLFDTYKSLLSQVFNLLHSATYLLIFLLGPTD